MIMVMMVMMLVIVLMVVMNIRVMFTMELTMIANIEEFKKDDGGLPVRLLDYDAGDDDQEDFMLILVFP